MPTQAFPYNRVSETPEPYELGHERFDLDYIKREALLLIHVLRKPGKDRFGDMGFKTQLDNRDCRILRRWGIK